MLSPFGIAIFQNDSANWRCYLSLLLSFSVTVPTSVLSLGIVILGIVPVWCCNLLALLSWGVVPILCYIFQCDCANCRCYLFVLLSFSMTVPTDVVIFQCCYLGVLSPFGVVIFRRCYLGVLSPFGVVIFWRDSANWCCYLSA